MRAALRRAVAGEQTGTYPGGVTSARPPGPARTARRGVIVVAGLMVLAGCASSHNPTFDPALNKPEIPGQSVGPGQGAGEVGLLGRGPDSTSCVGGWVAPAPGTLLYQRGVAGAGLPSGAKIAGVRFFSGPDPADHVPYDAVVSRWVVTLSEPIGGRGRLLVEQRATGVHLVAFAPPGSFGWIGGGWRVTAAAGAGPVGADAVVARLLPAYQTGCVA